MILSISLITVLLGLLGGTAALAMASASRSITAWRTMGSSCSHSITAAAGDSDRASSNCIVALLCLGHAAKQSVDEGTRLSKSVTDARTGDVGAASSLPAD